MPIPWHYLVLWIKKAEIACRFFHLIIHSNPHQAKNSLYDACAIKYWNQVWKSDFFPPKILILPQKKFGTTWGGERFFMLNFSMQHVHSFTQSMCINLHISELPQKSDKKGFFRQIQGWQKIHKIRTNCMQLFSTWWQFIMTLSNTQNIINEYKNTWLLCYEVLSDMKRRKKPWSVSMI